MITRFLRNVVLVAALLAVMGIVTIQGAESVTTDRLLAQDEEVARRDIFGRVEILKTYGGGGVCATMVTYGDDSMRIGVFAGPWLGPLRVRYMRIKINNRDYESLSDTTLMLLLRTVVRRHCLPHIVPGWTLV